MPKPFENEAGNGLHVHCSVLDENGVNIFDDGSEKGSPLLHSAIGGCLSSMADSVAVFTPSFNGYRRFQPGCHAPTYPSWGYENRTVAVRVPAGKQAARRLEHRVAGADANPYLLFAVLLSAMLDGIEQNLSPGKPISGDGYAQEVAKLPVYMPDAVNFSANQSLFATVLEASCSVFTPSPSSKKWKSSASVSPPWNISPTSKSSRTGTTAAREGAKTAAICGTKGHLRPLNPSSNLL